MSSFWQQWPKENLNKGVTKHIHKKMCERIPTRILQWYVYLGGGIMGDTLNIFAHLYIFYLEVLSLKNLIY